MFSDLGSYVDYQLKLSSYEEFDINDLSLGEIRDLLRSKKRVLLKANLYANETKFVTQNPLERILINVQKEVKKQVDKLLKHQELLIGS